MTCDRCGRERTAAQLVKSYKGGHYCRHDWAECDRIWRARQQIETEEAARAGS